MCALLRQHIRMDIEMGFKACAVVSTENLHAILEPQADTGEE